jgi:hypothetical protein
MNNFTYWVNEIADMPSKQDGVWVDLETGIAYDPSYNYVSKTTRTTLSAKALDARAIAKAFGGKALKGTAKQKEWAEKIRAQVLQGLTFDQAEMICDPNGLCTNSKFWIENRNSAAAEFGAFIESQKALLKTAKTLHAAGKAEEYKAVAAEYNALTAKWGF